jgi:anti-sigma B factor antagonist
MVTGLSGELDLATSPQLEKELELARSVDPTLLILDLSKPEFIDSAGISVIVKARLRAMRDGRRFARVKGSQRWSAC